MKIALLDIYKDSPYRQSKDTNGGYGIENDLGSGFVPWLMSRVVRYSMFWPSVSLLNIYSELATLGHHVHYTKSINDIDGSFEFVFLSVSIINCNHEIDAIKVLRSKYSGLKIIAFGSFLSVDKERFKAAGATVLIGEPEFLFQQMKMSKANLNLVHSLKEFSVIAADPDLLAPPLWAKNPQFITKNFIKGKISSFAPILATRGCPYSCYEYCVYPLQQGRKVRHTSVDKVIENIKLINSYSGAKNFVFRDPVFSINKKYTYELLEEMSSKISGLNFTIETHLNNITVDMAERLSSASVEWVKFGIESASDEVKDSVNRFTLRDDEQRLNIEICKQNRLKTDAMYIICQPLDTYETIQKTVDYAISLKTNIANFSMFTPYPGTPYYEKVKDQLLTNNFEDFSQYKLVYKHKIFNQTEARKQLGLAYKKYLVHKLFG